LKTAELASRENVPIATLNEALARAARAEHIALMADELK
jgi:hypothetical protein